MHLSIVLKLDRSRRWSIIALFNADLICRRAIAVCDLKSGPIIGYRRVDREHAAAQVKSEDFFDPNAVHPCGGTGVPSPAGTPDFSRSRIDVGRGNIRLPPE